MKAVLEEDVTNEGSLDGTSGGNDNLLILGIAGDVDLNRFFLKSVKVEKLENL
jgi:hypothetical protein